MTSKATAKKMYEYYTKQIDRLIEAQEALTSGGVKSYTLGDMQITRFDMSRLSKEIEKAVEMQSKYEAIMKGKPVRAMAAIVPTDIPTRALLTKSVPCGRSIRFPQAPWRTSILTISLSVKGEECCIWRRRWLPPQ